jgi:endonuclease YncB( thermonuclease family)
MKTLIAGVLAVALGLAACGSGDYGSSAVVLAPATTTAVATAAAAEVSTTTTPPTTTPSAAAEAPTTQSTLAPATAPPAREPPTTAAPLITVVNVVDGDTVDLSTGERVRIIGVDTPERGVCGFQDAGQALAALVAGKAVTVTAGARDDIDKYGRILRYIDVDGVDVGLTLIQHGLAVARYDGRDGYGHHPRQEAYVDADTASASVCTPATTAASPPLPSTATSSAYYANCTEARAAGVAPLHEGEPGYRAGLDRDHDGVACE